MRVTDIAEPKDYIVATNELGRYCVPVSSAYTHTSQRILSGGIHEPETIRFITENCGSGHVVHAGAGFGDFLPALAEKCKATVWAFEPNQENYDCAKKTIELNELTNVNLFNLGLGKMGKRSSLKVEQNNKRLGPRCEIVEDRELLETKEYELIEMVALDTVIPEEFAVSIVHLDVEGYEEQVLLGAEKLISRSNPIIILEIHKEALKYNQFMESIGYQPAQHLIYDAGPMVFVNTVYKKQSRA